MPDGDNGGSGGMGGAIALATAAVALAAAVIGLLTDWYGLKSERRCSIAGTITETFSGQPMPGAQVGWAPNNGEVADPRQLDFRALATTGDDGSFSGDCHQIDENGTDGFEVLVRARSLVRGGSGGTLGLPCLTPRRTGRRVEPAGKQADVNVAVQGC